MQEIDRVTTHERNVVLGVLLWAQIQNRLESQLRQERMVLAVGIARSTDPYIRFDAYNHVYIDAMRHW